MGHIPRIGADIILTDTGYQGTSQSMSAKYLPGWIARLHEPQE